MRQPDALGWTDPQVTIKFPNQTSRNAFMTWLETIGGQQFCEADHFTAERQERAAVDRFLFPESPANLTEQRATNRIVVGIIL